MGEYLFVYGTLRKGLANHHFLQGAKFIGLAQTLHKYALFEAEYPLVVRDRAVSNIRGELYEVNQAILARVDILEDHPNLYYRAKIPVIIIGTEARFTAWMYFFPVERGRLIRSGDYVKCL